MVEKILSRLKIELEYLLDMVDDKSTKKEEKYEYLLRKDEEVSL